MLAEYLAAKPNRRTPRHRNDIEPRGQPRTADAFPCHVNYASLADLSGDIMDARLSTPSNYGGD